ncbi:upper zone of growth plate and cartilage matrix associated a [Neosynchiropus ocellatus]
MSQVVTLCLLSAVLILSFSSLGESAVVRDNSKSDQTEGVAQGVFMKGPDASNFFKRRSRRSPKYYAELQAEQQVKRAHSERLREYNEEQLDEFENYAEEERDEQNERTRERNEQYREFHYDGLQPRYYWFH